MKKLLLGCIVCLLLFSCDKDDISDNPLDSNPYFPLQEGNRWEYDVTVRNSGYSSENKDYTMVIEVVSNNDNSFSVECSCEDYSFSKSLQLIPEKEGVYNQSGKLIVPSGAQNIEVGVLCCLFETHYSTESLSGEVGFSETNGVLKCEFRSGLSWLFSETYVEGVGLKSWTDQKNTSGYYGWVSDTYRGTLTKSVINGVTNSY